MTEKKRHRGVALLMTVFVVALLSAVTIGLILVNTAEIQQMGNHVYAAEALATAQAGLNDAFSEIRDNADWDNGFTDKAFADGSYSVVVTAFDETTDPLPPDLTDNELTVAVLGALYPGVTRDFTVSHPDLDGNDWDSRARITINAGSYSYTGGMNGSPFTISVPFDAATVDIQIIIKKQDYPIPANVNCQVSWDVAADSGGSSNYRTIVSEGTSPRGFVSRVAADVTVGSTSPHSININEIRINE
jgi:hypothetical protein